MMRDALKNRQRPARTKKIAVPEWSALGDIYVRMLGADERDAWEATNTDEDGRLDAKRLRRSRFVALVTSDADGARIFKDEDVSWLGQEPSDVIEAVWEAGLAFNAMRLADAESAEKNFEPAPGV